MIEYNGREFKRVVCWFSCGAASAVATKLALKKFGAENCVVVYQDTGSEHPDNKRFLNDCERWFGQPITVIRSEKYSDIWDVFEKTRWIVGPAGARCTSELKRKVAEDFLDHFNDLEVLGYTIEEKARLARWQEHNTERFLAPLLIDAELDKSDCLGLLDKAGIEIPAMYLLGYQNNNCIGCVKGQSGYWNKIRIDFPEVFDRMARMEREIGAAINKRYEGGDRIAVYLDELPPDAGNFDTEPSISCGLFCQLTDFDDLPIAQRGVSK